MLNPQPIRKQMTTGRAHGLSGYESIRGDSHEELQRLTLIPRLVPRPLWGRNMRGELSGTQTRWAEISASVRAASGGKCGICSSKKQLECDEDWFYDDKNHVARLIGLRAVCRLCHEAIHFGRTQKVDPTHSRDVMIHACRVNWRRATIKRQREWKRIFDAEMEAWHERNRHSWRVDVSGSERFLPSPAMNAVGADESKRNGRRKSVASLSLSRRGAELSPALGKNRKVKDLQKICFLDVETWRTNFNRPEKSKIAFVGVLWCDYRDRKASPGRFQVFDENELQALEKLLREFKGLIVGHNLFQFDYRVMASYVNVLPFIAKSSDTLLKLRSRSQMWGDLSLEGLCCANRFPGKRTIDGSSVARLWRIKSQRWRVLKRNENDLRMTRLLWNALIKNSCVQALEFHGYCSIPTNIHVRLRDSDVAHLLGKTAQANPLSWRKAFEAGKMLLPPKLKKNYRTLGRHTFLRHCKRCGGRP